MKTTDCISWNTVQGKEQLLDLKSRVRHLDSGFVQDVRMPAFGENPVELQTDMADPDSLLQDSLIHQIKSTWTVIHPFMACRDF